MPLPDSRGQQVAFCGGMKVGCDFELTAYIFYLNQIMITLRVATCRRVLLLETMVGWILLRKKVGKSGLEPGY